MTQDTALAPPRDEADLEERLSRPPAALGAMLAHTPGDLIILGAGGKMGPSLARMARRADPARRVIAVSRWSNRAAADGLRALGIEIAHADLLDPRSLTSLPDAPNVVFMAGQKFGTASSPATTWAMNAGVPAFISERYAGSRTVVFSTGNVYALTPHHNGGSREDDAPAPVGTASAIAQQGAAIDLRSPMEREGALRCRSRRGGVARRPAASPSPHLMRGSTCKPR